MDRVLNGRADPGAGIDRAVLKPILFGLASLPVLLALVTWDLSEIGQLWAYLHFPVLAGELAVVLIAQRSGFSSAEAIVYWPRWARGALAVLILVSIGTAAFRAPMPATAAIHTAFMAVHLLFGLTLFDLVVRHGLKPEDNRGFWIWVAAASVSYCVILALFVASIPDPERFDWVRLGLGVVHVRQVGFYGITGACAALGLAVIACNRAAYWSGIAIASVIIGTIVWSGSRGPLVAILAVFLLGAAMLPSLRSLHCAAAVLTSTVAGTLLSFVHQPPSPFYGLSRILGTAAASSVDELGSGRITMWLGTLREIAESPLFGYGAAQFRMIVPEALGTFNSPHNVFLQIALQWGLLGAACFFALLGFVWFRFMRAIRTGPEALIPSFLVVNALLIFSLYDVVAYYAYPMVMIAIGMILVLATELPENRAARIS